MNTTNLFQIDGQPLLIPDEGLSLGRTDTESADSGRDESGTLHRFLLGAGVEHWDFVYGRLTAAEYAYMEGLFAGKNTFQFTCPGSTTARTVTAYRSRHTVRWQSAADGTYRDYQFRIQTC
jgi:hypothetical protein